MISLRNVTVPAVPGDLGVRKYVLELSRDVGDISTDESRDGFVCPEGVEVLDWGCCYRNVIKHSSKGL